MNKCFVCEDCSSHYDFEIEALSCCDDDLITDRKKKKRWNCNKLCDRCDRIIIKDVTRSRRYIPYEFRKLI